MNSFKKARLVEGLTQFELAEKLNVSHVTISQWERGTCFPRARRLKEIANALNTTVEELIDDRVGA